MHCGCGLLVEEGEWCVLERVARNMVDCIYPELVWASVGDLQSLSMARFKCHR